MIRLRVPGDKSISHRALLLSALAQGRSRVRGILTSLDPAATADVLRRLGVLVPALVEGRELRVRGLGLRGLRQPASELDCANSGTTARLMLGVLAAQGVIVEVTGDASLRARPMRRVTGPLARMGATFEELGEADRLPIRVRGGALEASEHVSPRASAQVKSALLLAGVCAGVPVRVREPTLSRDHTERLLRAQGVHVSTTVEGGEADIALEPAELLQPLDIDVPGDFSSAAFLIALAVLGGCPPLSLEGVGVNPTRTGLLRVLRRMGTGVDIVDETESSGEPIANLVAERADLAGTRIEREELPSLIDEVPIVAILAARASGETVVSGAEELRVKESDRLAAIVGNLRALGVDAEERPDGLRVVGTEKPLSGLVRTHGDHRIAMAFGVLAALPDNDIRLDDPASADVSFPGFWRRLRSLSGRASEG